MKPRGFAAPSHPLHGRTAEAGKKSWENLRAVRRKNLTAETMRSLQKGAETLSDVQWHEVKNAVLLATVTNPTANAGASLKAIEAMDRQREKAKFGSKEAVEETLRKCESRLRELAMIDALGSGRGGGDAENLAKSQGGTE